MSSESSNGRRYDAEGMDAVLFRRVEEHEEQLASYRVDIVDILATGRITDARVAKLAERFHDFDVEQRRQGKLLEAIAATVGAL